MLSLLFADLGHALAHTVSARWAGAPTDEIQVSSGMPRTIYFDNDVSPRAHQLRALGGPVFNAAGLLVALLQRALSPRDSVMHELANWSCISHGVLFAGSLMPLPVVDGGTILKWALVERGHTPAAADVAVQRASLATGATTTAAGLLLAARRRWLPAGGLVLAGLFAIGVGLLKIR
jgi:hypothetical protein